LDAELQLDRLKPRLSRRVLLLEGHQPSWHGALALVPGTPPLCHSLNAYLRAEAEFKDKLSPVALSLSLALPGATPGLVLYGDTLVQAQVWGDVAELGTSPLSPGLGSSPRLGQGTPSPGHPCHHSAPAPWSPACPQRPQSLPGMWP
ncbi:ITA2B protein, partial [Nyctibius bracteatus]|nr:ITA2B protein [Nyctibius bracteatus]